MIEHDIRINYNGLGGLLPHLVIAKGKTSDSRYYSVFFIILLGECDRAMYENIYF